jgi:outer membrane receptor for ferrienterochelin and colicins
MRDSRFSPFASPSVRLAALTACMCLSAPVIAQDAGPITSVNPATPPANPALAAPVDPSASSAAQTPEPPPSNVENAGRIEVRGRRQQSDERQRQMSTAAKIVIGREEIERQGDSTVGEVIKRLPGVTVQGAPGRGGAIQMRGLGGGYTQILLDGQRVPPGFSIESLTPEMVERIEVLRSPTAETGARAIAGTINIILREGYREKNSDLKVSVGVEDTLPSTQLQWVRPLQWDGMDGNLTLSYGDTRRIDDTLSESDTTEAGTLTERTRDTLREGRRQALHLTSRLQWRGEQGRSLVLMPMLIVSDYRSDGTVSLQETVGAVTHQAQGLQASDSRFTMLRLNGQWNQRLGADQRLEARWGLGQSAYRYDFAQTQSIGPADLLGALSEVQDFTDRQWSLSGKHIAVHKDAQTWTSGLEFEGVRRDESGSVAASDDKGNLKASSLRSALYTQNEWVLSPQWSAYGGLRYESILTESSAADGLRRNHSGVWTPLLHAAYKPVAGGKDLIRMSLTRSYKAPTMFNLVARPSLSRDYPVNGENTPIQPDRVGNPDLRPELATGIDLAYEHYPSQGGVLSANVFHRQISDLIRYTTTERTDTPWANGFKRYVSSPSNVGDAVTQGVELEAKFKLSEYWPGAPGIDVRSNVSFFKSRVKDLAGPDNRLDRQPDRTANLGLDHRWSGTKWTAGGSWQHNPAYDTRISQTQWAYQGMKRALDVYALWRQSPLLALRLSVTNALPDDHVTGSSYISPSLSSTSTSTDRVWRAVQLRLEMKI